jgi:L-ascorbate metabolism protein UlaG (beta-lactamase superfamily)
MIITWLGHFCFKIQDKTGSDGVTLTTDPFDKSIGLKMTNFESDIITVSSDNLEHNFVDGLRGTPFIVNTPGEYDIKGIFVQGVEASDGADKKNQNIIYRITIDDISLVHLGRLSTVLENKQLEHLVGTDILLLPVGGKNFLDAKKAMEVVSQIEPRIVIPMAYKIPDLKLDYDGVEKFIKEIGIKPTEEERLKISKKELPQEDMELVILKI